MLMLSFNCPDLSGQEFPEYFSSLGSHYVDAELTAAADGDYVFSAGVGYSECGPRVFVRRYSDTVGPNINNTFLEPQYGPVRRMLVVDNFLFAVSTWGSNSKWSADDNTYLFKIHPITLKVIWQRPLADQLGIDDILDIRPYGDQALMVVLRTREPGICRVHFMERMHGEWGADLQIDNAEDEGEFRLRTDSEDNLLLFNKRKIVKLAPSGLTFSDTLWSFDIRTTAPQDSVLQVYPNVNQRDVVLTAGGEVYEFGSQGELLRRTSVLPPGLSGSVEQALLRDTLLYMIWSNPQSAVHKTEIVAFNMVSAELAWNVSSPFGDSPFLPAELQLSNDNELCIAGVLDTAQIGAATLDGRTGELVFQDTIRLSAKSVNKLQTVRAGNRVWVAAGIDSSWFRWGRKSAVYYMFDRIQKRLYGLPELSFSIKQRAYPLGMVGAQDGYLAVRQAGTMPYFVKYDQLSRMKYSRSIPSDSLAILESFAWSGNATVGLICRRGYWDVETQDEYGLKIVPRIDSSLLDVYMYNPPTSGGTIYTYRQEQGAPVSVKSGVVVKSSTEVLFLLHDPLRDQSLHRIVRTSRLQKEISRVIPMRVSARPEAVGLMPDGHDKVLLLGAAAPNSSVSTLYRLEPFDLTTRVLMSWPQCNELLFGLRNDDEIALVGLSESEQDSTMQYAEILHYNLNTSMSNWRLRLPQLNNARILARDVNSELLFAVGHSVAQDRSDSNLVITAINDVNGAVEWVKQFNLASPDRFIPTDAVVYQNTLVLCGALHGNPYDRLIRSFILRYSMSGEQISLQILDSTRALDLFVTPDDRLLLNGEQYFTENCVRRGMTIELDLMVDVAESSTDRAGDVNIFPNPTEGSCSFVYPGVPGLEYSVVVRDLPGRTVLAFNTRLQDVESGVRLDLALLTAGTYSVEVAAVGAPSAERFKTLIVKR